MDLESEIEYRLRGDDMQINGDIPKSTLAVAAILWAVLAALGAWTLNMVSDMRGDMRAAVERNASQDARIDGIERRVDRHDDEIREIQRARK